MPIDASPRLRRVALAGNPNVGKTTVFNLLTGMRQKVGNYPVVTVERKSGRMAGDQPVEIIDLPGTYSLTPRSQDEQIAYDMLVGRLNGEPAPDLVVCVADATNLERNLFLISQIMDLGLPTVVVMNMMDTAESRGLHLNVSSLSRALGAPIIPMVATRKDGVEALRKAISEPVPPPPPRRWRLRPAVGNEISRLEALLANKVPEMAPVQRFSEALRALESDPALSRWETRVPDFHAAILEARRSLSERNIPFDQAEIDGRYAWLEPLLKFTVSRDKDPSEQTHSDRLDAVLTHPVAGPAIFFVILMVVFQAVFSWATPAMDLILAGMSELGILVRSVLPAGMVSDLLVDGAIGGVGNVLVFLPQILLLFFFLGLMEDTGYMARTSLIMDRVMSRIGLSGGSVVPLLSSFACAIPGIMATRTMPNQRDRLITIMVAPLMSCSARLPVYTLFIAAFIPTGHLFGFIGYQGLTMVILYLLGMSMAFVAAWILQRFIFKNEASFFAIELPPYRVPQIQQVLVRMVTRSKMFVVRAGKIIFTMSIVLWFLATYPRTAPDANLQARQDAIESTYHAALDEIATERGTDTKSLLADPSIRHALRLLAATDTIQEGANVDSPHGALSAIRSIDPDAATDAQAIFAVQKVRNTARREFSNALSAYKIQHSIVGRIGHLVEPVMRPLGFDWKISAGLLTALAAREVIISTLGTIYSVGDVDETSTALRDHLKSDRYEDGTPVFTPLVAVSLLVFFVLAMQCMSTLAITRRETNSWFWPAVMWAYMTGMAYLFSLAIYQGGMALGLG